jgi:hypothetical protein
VLSTDQKGIAAETMIAAYCAEVAACYLLPRRLSVEKTEIQLRVAPVRNNQSARIDWARDFEMRATLRALQGPIAQLGERHAGSVEAAGSSPAGSITKARKMRAFVVFEP